MKRILLTAALLAAPLAHAQWDYDERDRGYRDFTEEVAQLEDELDRLREDPRVLDYAADELARAEDYIEDLAADPPHAVDHEDVREAERLLARVERVAMEGSVDEPGRVVILDDDDDEAWDEARDARSEAERARLAAEEERERAMAARLEAEHERNANARLRDELGRAQTRETDRGIVLTLGDVLFSVGKSDLKPGAKRTLDKLVAAMRRDPDATVTIEGHTDSTGKRAYNLELSKRRAIAVRSYLSSKGVASQRIKARGLGPDFPVATNNTEAGRQQNRRVELLVQNDGFEE
ncbi:MAG TPA: OmpA family protein [Xanthomonadales bacterium]|nr:OmpA family protein [Xanthomonadales bacterium]